MLILLIGLNLNNYTYTIEVLKNKFKDYFRKDYLEFTCLDQFNNTDVYRNKYTKLSFIHDFPHNSQSCFDKIYEVSKKKYDRRIKRILGKLKKRTKICLIYVEWKKLATQNENITNDILAKDIKELNNLYKGVSFDIFYIQHNENFVIDKFKIDNRICIVNNTPNGHHLGNLNLISQIVRKRIKLKKISKLKIVVNKIIKLIQLYLL